jgi:hypothetical protein
MIDDGCNIVFEHVPLFSLPLFHFSYITNPIIFLNHIEFPMFLNNNYLSEIMKWFKEKMTFWLSLLYVLGCLHDCLLSSQSYFQIMIMQIVFDVLLAIVCIL